MEPSVQKLMIKFKLDEGNVSKLLGAGLDSPTKIRKAAKDKTLPASLGAVKTQLELKFKKV